MLQVMPKPEHEETAAECLYKALDKAPQMKKVLVLWEMEDGPLGSSDNGLTLEQAVYLIEMFKHWILKSALGEK